MLNANASQDIHSLQVPFMAYYRKTNWEVDRERRGVESPQTALRGDVIANMYIRYMNTKATFSAYFIFGRDDEAQIAYETLLWAKHPSAKQFTFPGLAYKDYRLDLPIQLWVDNVTYNPQIKEQDWLKKNRMVIVQADFTLKSVIIAPIAQGAKSSLFETIDGNEAGFYITKEAYLDYFSSKNLPLPDEAYYDLMVSGEMNNDPTLVATMQATDITNTSMTINWDFNDGAREFYEDNVKITTNNGLEFEASMDAKTFTVTGLQPASTYEVFLWFYSKQAFINKYNILATTAAADYKPLKLKTLPGR